MRTIEIGTDWLTRFGNATAVDMDRITTRCVIIGPWATKPGPDARDTQTAPIFGRSVVTGEFGSSLFWNGRRFIRTVYVDGRPRGWFFMFRWTGAARSVRGWTVPQYFQCGVGWKLNGRLAITFRFQTDASAAMGVTGHNWGQAVGWDWGTK